MSDLDAGPSPEAADGSTGDSPEPMVAALDRGDGSADALLLGAVDAGERLIGAVNVLGEVVEVIAERLDGLEETQAARPASVPLREWVDWLRVGYGLHALIPEDWTSHRGTAQEVLALHAGWCAAHSADGRPLPGPAASSWHEGLVRALDRIQSRWSRLEGVSVPPLPGHEEHPASVASAATGS